MTGPRAHPVDFEPSLIDDRTYSTRRGGRGFDVMAAVSVMIGLLTLLPARLIVPGMTDLGRPALVLCLLMWLWWLLAKVHPRLAMPGPQPMRWIAAAFLLTLFASYAVGNLRGMTTMEANAADRALLFGAALTGVILVIADGCTTWVGLKRMLRVFVWCAAIMGLIGIVQYMLFFDITTYLEIPGLQSKGWVPDFEIRGSGVRVASTTAHYIEFSAVLVMALPFALHFALHSQTRPQRQAHGIAALVILAAIPTTLSRTGFAATVIVAAVLAVTWSWRTRFNIAVAGAGLVALMLVAKPNLVDTVWELFAKAEADPSITARTKRYDMVSHYFSQAPWLGRGTGTWVSPQYQYLDNQWLSFALTNGVFGVVVLAAVHLGAITLAGLAWRRSTNPADRHMCAALVSTQLVAIFAGATFDSLSFSTFAVVIAVVTGAAGAVWRLTHPTRLVRTSMVGAESAFAQEKPL